jgi:hypothetical protein
LVVFQRWLFVVFLASPSLESGFVAVGGVFTKVVNETEKRSQNLHSANFACEDFCELRLFGLPGSAFAGLLRKRTS